MRYLLLSIAALIMTASAPAQMQLGGGTNTASQPLWGPVGYDYVDYYYLPELEIYFDVVQKKFYHLEDGQWKRTSDLPARFREYDIYQLYKVVVNDWQPFNKHQWYKDRYASFRGHRPQQTIRDSRDARYFVVKSYSGLDMPAKRAGFSGYRGVEKSLKQTEKD